MSEDDFDLSELLNNLEKEADPSAPLPGVNPRIIEQAAKLQEKTPEKKAEPVAKAEISTSTTAPSQLVVADPPKTISRLDSVIENTLNDFERSGKEIIDNYRNDREELSRTINFLDDVVRGVNNEGNALDVSGTIVESLVKAHEVRSSLGLTLVKLLDSKTRLIASVKSQLVINNINSQANDQGDLTAFLLQPVESDLNDEAA